MLSRKETTVHLAQINTSVELHDLFAEQLHFPIYYGRNWNAFWDCISSQSQSRMPDVLIIRGLEALIHRLPDDAEIMRSCFDDYLIQNPEKSVYFSNRACPCCGYMTLGEYFPGSFEICPICFWEDDNVQCDNPYFEGSANRLSLKEAQRNFVRFGACTIEMKRYVREPGESDIKDPRWKTAES